MCYHVIIKRILLKLLKKYLKKLHDISIYQWKSATCRVISTGKKIPPDNDKTLASYAC